MSSVPKTMKAAQITKPGDFDVIEVVDVPVPTPSSGEVLVKVEWAGVNFIDTYFRSGLYKTNYPTTLGQEAAGIVIALGDGVDPDVVKTGDRVAVSRPLSGFAEYIAANAERQVIKLPDGVSTKDGAAILLQGLTAVTLVDESHKVEKGQFVLIHAVAGGMGCAHRGAIVFGTTSTAEKAEIAKKHGASHVFLYTQNSYDSITEKIKAITGGNGIDAGVHVVFDGVGKDTFESNFDVLRRKGTFVSFGNASGPAPAFAPLKLTPKNLRFCRPSVMGYLGSTEEWKEYTGKLLKLLEDKALRVNVHKEYAFSTEGIRQTQKDITGRGTAGKLVVKVH